MDKAMNRAPHVVIIGAGAVGAATALHALEAGLRVTLVDPFSPGSQHAASYGNAGWLTAHSILPPAEPGAWKKIPKWLSDPLGPLAIRWTHLPRALPWLWRYLRAAWTWQQVERTAHALRSLLRDAPVLHAAQAQRAGVPELIEQRGVLHAFLSEAHFRAESRAWDIRRQEGVQWQALDAQALREREPDIDPRYTFAVWVPESGTCLDPGAYVAGLIRHAQSLGAELCTARATGFRIEQGRLRAVLTEGGEIVCDKAVIAAGVRSRDLARQAGDRVPLAAERGYHAVIRNVKVKLRTPTNFADAKVIVNNMNGGLRAAGQVEIASIDAPPNWDRARIMHRHLQSIFPGLASSPTDEDPDVWLGCRPSMADGLPCIGSASASVDVIHAYGHGHVGLAGSARTGRVVAQLLAGQAPEIDLAPFSPRRFA